RKQQRADVRDTQRRAPVLVIGRHQCVVARPEEPYSRVIDRAWVEDVGAASRIVLRCKGRQVACRAVEYFHLDTCGSPQAALMVVRIASVHFERGAELVVHSAGIILKKRARWRIVGEIADRSGAAE